MSSVVVLTPIIIASWPAVASAVAGAAASMGFTLVATKTEIHNHAKGSESITTEIADSEIIAETLSRGEKIHIVREKVSIEIGVDDHGRCSVCVTGPKSKAELKRIADDCTGRILQQFAYHKIVTELKQRGYAVSSESVQKDESIQMHVRMK